jgi:O-antigen/teichoic acid export membrane protein
MHEENRSLAQNTALQVAGKALSTLFGVLTIAILTRALGTAGYGELTTALTFLSLFAVVVDFGLTLTTTAMISDQPAKEEKILGNLVALRVVSAVAFLSLAPIAVIFFPYSSVIKLAVAIGAISYFFGTTAQMLIGVYQKRLAMKRAIAAELINRAVVLIGAVIAYYIGLSVTNVMWILVLGNGLQLAAMIGLAKNFVRLRPQIDWMVWREIIARSWPIGASIFFNLIYMRGDILVLSLYVPQEQIGIYGAAYKVIDVITSVPVMYMGLALPILVAAWAGTNRRRFVELLQDSFDFFAIFALPIAFGCVALGIPMMRLVAGDEFAVSGAVLSVLGPAAAVVFFGALSGHAVVALQQQKKMVWGYLLVAIVSVIGYFIFIPSYGIWAAAWWTLISETAITLLTGFVIYKTSGFKPNLKIFSKAFLASLVMFAAVKFMPGINVLILIALGALVYGVALTALGGPSWRTALKLFVPEKPPITPA